MRHISEYILLFSIHKIWKIKIETQCDINNRNIQLKPEQDGFCSHGWLRELCEYYPRHARLEEFRSDLIKGQNDMLIIRLSKLFAGDKKSELFIAIESSDQFIYSTDLKGFKE